MYRVFNMGIGMVVITPPDQAEDILSHLGKGNISAFRVGTIVEGDGKVVYMKS